MADERPIRSTPRRKPSAVKAEVPTRTVARNAVPGWWDKPSFVNTLADVFGVLGLAALLVAAGYWLLNRPVFPVRSVLVLTPMGQVTSAQISYAARSAIKGNFFTVDLGAVRSAFETLPWVRRAEVRRNWPDTLEVRLEEQQSVAYWMDPESGDTRLVNKHGEVFYASSNTEMPLLSGPQGSSKRILQAYQNFEPLVRSLGRLSEVRMSERQAWYLKIAEGPAIVVGREQGGVDLESQITRFVQVFSTNRNRIAGKVVHADLRYPSGFAVKTAASLNTDTNAVNSQPAVLAKPPLNTPVKKPVAVVKPRVSTTSSSPRPAAEPTQSQKGNSNEQGI